MSRINYKRSGGFTLIEALIAMLVMALGIVALARFHGGLLQSSGGTKARSEAISIAQQEMETRRAVITASQADFNTYENPDNDEIALTATTISSCDPATESDWTDLSQRTGKNATFTPAYCIRDLANPARKEILMQVEWDDPKGGAQRVFLNSVIAWTNTIGSIGFASGGESGGGGSIPTPQGGATTNIPESRHHDSLPDNATSNNDGTWTYENTEYGQTELLDSTGQVLMIIYEGSAIVTISGKVYIANGLSTSKIHVIASEAAYCPRNIPNDISGNTDSGIGDPAWPYFEYTCYVATGWYGNVGIQFFDASRSNQGYALGGNEAKSHVCVGGPDSNDSAGSRYRSYRGYDYRMVNGTQFWFPVGIQIDEDGNDDINNLNGVHHFVIHNFNQPPDDEDCAEILPNFTDAIGEPNLGQYVCLSDYCPDWSVSGHSEVPGITVSGSLIHDSSTVQFTSVTSDDASCEIVDSTTYVCTGVSPWTGTITIAAEEEVSAGDWSPLTCAGGEDSYTWVDEQIENVTHDFDVSSCD